MTVLRLYDPARTPTSWTEIIRPGQFVAFAKRIDTGAPCDERGQPFRTVVDTTALLFDGSAAGKGYCEAQVNCVPIVRFEIFDSAGRVNAPLYGIVHPAKVGQLEGNPRAVRLGTRALQLNRSFADAEHVRRKRVLEHEETGRTAVASENAEV